MAVDGPAATDQSGGMARQAAGTLGPIRVRDQLLVETFSRAGRNYLMVCLSIRWAACVHQTLVHAAHPPSGTRQGCPPDGLRCQRIRRLRSGALRDHGRHVGRDGPNSRLPISSMRTCWAMIWRPGLTNPRLFKRTFQLRVRHDCRADRKVGIRARRRPGRQMTVSSDLIYDVLRSHEPDHILLASDSRNDAQVPGNWTLAGLVPCCRAFRGRIVHKDAGTGFHRWRCRSCSISAREPVHRR